MMLDIDQLALNREIITTKVERLDRRITQFEAWISDLKGKTKTEFKCTNDLWLMADREKNSWHIYYRISTLSEWDLLIKASILRKMTAIRYFDDLLTNMSVTQRRMMADLDLAVTEFDKFALTINMKVMES